MEENQNKTISNVDSLLDVRQPINTKEVISSIINNVKIVTPKVTPIYLKLFSIFRL